MRPQHAAASRHGRYRPTHRRPTHRARNATLGGHLSLATMGITLVPLPAASTAAALARPGVARAFEIGLRPLGASRFDH